MKGHAFFKEKIFIYFSGVRVNNMILPIPPIEVVIGEIGQKKYIVTLNCCISHKILFPFLL